MRWVSTPISPAMTKATVPIRVRSARLLRICLRETLMPSIPLRRPVPTSPNLNCTPNPGQNWERGIFMKYGYKLKLDRVLKHEEGRRDFAAAARNKKLFKSIITTAKGSKAKQDGCPLQNPGKHPCRAYDMIQPTCQFIGHTSVPCDTFLF